MQIKIWFPSSFVHISVTWLFNCTIICQGFLHHEFGNVLHQDLKTVKHTESDVSEVIKYVQQYVRKRYPWSTPGPLSQGPDPRVSQLRKRILIYSHDGEIPLFYDDTTVDRLGNQHGITRFITLGTTYNFMLTWTESMINFCHNFTVSVYPNDYINIYAHTYFLQNLNITKSNPDISHYLFPKVGNSYFKYISNREHLDLGQFSYTPGYADFHMNDETLLNSYTNKPNTYLSETEEEEYDPNKGPITDKSLQRETFTVMTYNIWNMNSKSTKIGGYTDRMKRVREVILKAAPDIIALQEVRFEEMKGEELGPSQIHTLSEWLPQYQFVYQPAQMQPNTIQDGRTEEGVAILSKFPIISHNCIMMFINRSNSADMHQRVLLQAEIFIPSIGRVHVFTTHLSLSHEAREQSVIQIWKHVRSIQGPVIVLGDFNAEPQEPAMQYLSGKKVFSGEEQSQLIDIWSKLYPGNKGFTYNSLLKNLTKRIDYIFWRGWDQCCNIDSCNILDDGSRGYKAASDHVPLITTLSMNTKSRKSG